MRGVVVFILSLAVIIVGITFIVMRATQRDAGAKTPPPLPDDVDLISGGIGNVDVWHDRVRHVTCWEPPTTTNGAGMWCIPDWQLTPPEPAR